MSLLHPERMKQMATVKNAAPETVSVYIPKIPGAQPSLWVALNGQSWNIPRGKRVEVPAKVAKLIQHCEANAQVADAYADEKRRELADQEKKFF